VQFNATLMTRVVLLTLCLPVTAQATMTAEACVTISDDAQRLTCYDTAFNRIPSPGTAATAAARPTTAEVTVPAAASAAPAITSDAESGAPRTTDSAPAAEIEPEAQFGMSPQMKLERQNQTELKSITANVTRVDYSTPDRRIFTLDNGQVWLQTETTPRLRVSPGDTVTIKRALMGSFLLVSANSGSTRARRIQ
jgi:hypothetical protein